MNLGDVGRPAAMYSVSNGMGPKGFAAQGGGVAALTNALEDGEAFGGVGVHGVRPEDLLEAVGISCARNVECVQDRGDGPLPFLCKFAVPWEKWVAGAVWRQTTHTLATMSSLRMFVADSRRNVSFLIQTSGANQFGENSHAC